MENQRFIDLSLNIIQDESAESLRKSVLKRYEQTTQKGTTYFVQLEKARKRAEYFRNKVVNDLDRYLIEFEDNFTANGGKVIWARFAEEVYHELDRIIERHGITKVVKDRALISNELKMTEHLQRKGHQVGFIDSEEFLLSKAKDVSEHMIHPAMMYTAESIAAVYPEIDNESPSNIRQYLAKQVTDQIQEPQLVITGTDFLISDSGLIAGTDTTGLVIESIYNSKVHVVIAGIDQLLPSLESLDIVWPLKSTYSAGVSTFPFQYLLSGSEKGHNIRNTNEVIVILVDNGRSSVLEYEKQRQALTCIQCGSCMNVCPVYKRLGGKVYGTAYQGPIASVIMPLMNASENMDHLSYASTLCGRCDLECPVNIPIHKLILFNRNKAVQAGQLSASEQRKVRWLSKAMSSRKLLDLPGGSIKNMLIKKSMGSDWDKARTNPVVATKSFNKMWKEQRS